MTLFEKIIARQIPATIVYEDDRAIAFRDVAPAAPVHVLVVPKRPVVSLAAATDEDAALLGHLMVVARKIAEQERLEEGWRLVANNGPDAGQSVDHLHLHVLGGRKLAWPPG